MYNLKKRHLNPTDPSPVFLKLSASGSSPALLEWNYVQQRFPWSVLLLLGGGYAISDASKVSGLSIMLAHYLSALAALPPFAVMFLMCLLASAMTEIASNAAVASILLPIVAQIVRDITNFYTENTCFMQTFLK